MKKATSITIFFIGIYVNVFSQNNWVQKHILNDRYYAVGFSIGDKGYIGTGTVYGHDCKKDFWEYDPANNTWTQKADFGGTQRYSAVGFSIGNKGYIGTGITDNYPNGFVLNNDFWQYNPVTNTWIMMADFPGAGRYYSTGFSIGFKGYIGAGSNGTGTHYNDFWQYDPTLNLWVQKANIAGPIGSYHSAGFSIGNRGYIVMQFYNQFREYNPTNDTWTQKGNYPGNTVSNAVGFSIGSRGYFGTGNTSSNSFYEYNPYSDTWTQKANFAGSGRWGAVGFSIGTKGYIGTGCHLVSSYVWPYNNFYEYTPTQYCPVFKIAWNRTDITAPGANDGTINIQVTNGTQPYSFLWSDGYTLGARINIANGAYTITITDSNGCSASHLKTWGNNPARIAGGNISDIINIYPNPSSTGIFNLVIDQSETVSDFTFKVIDINGKTIEEMKIDQNTEDISIDLSSKPKGIYLIYLMNNEIVQTQKIIIQ